MEIGISFASLLNLNDDCLLEICNNLSILDKICLSSEICPHLQDIIYRKYKKVDLFNWCCYNQIPTGFKEQNFKKIYENIGKYIEDLAVYGENYLLSRRINIKLGPPHIHLIFASQYSPNLQKLELNGLNYSRNQWLNYFLKIICLSNYSRRLQRELENFESLKTLSLCRCIDLPNYFFQKVSNISALILHSSDITNVKYFKYLTNLEFLSIECCNMPEPIQLLKNNVKLKELTILSNSYKNLRYSSHEFLYALANLQSLIYLHADCLKNLPIERLNSLKYLIIQDDVPYLGTFLKKNQLQMLDIGGGEHFIDMAYDLEECLVNCTNLKLLNLPSAIFRNLAIQQLSKKMHLKTFDGLKIKCSEHYEYFLVFEVYHKFAEYFDTSFITNKIFKKISNMSTYQKTGRGLLMDPKVLTLCKWKVVHTRSPSLTQSSESSIDNLTYLV